VNDERFRFVTEQNGHEFVSRVRLSEAEARDFLTVDTLLHRAAGWWVTERPELVVARRGEVVRLVSVRRIAG